MLKAPFTLIAIAGASVILTPVKVWSAGKSRPRATPVSGSTTLAKRILALAPVEAARIDLPAGGVRSFGPDFERVFARRLQETGRWVVIDLPSGEAGSSSFSRDAEVPDYHWSSRPVPSATLRVHVDALSFTTGSRGDRTFYGFDSRSRNAYNDGTAGNPNEFYLKDDSQEDPSWFDHGFDARGNDLVGSRTGLDLGDGFLVDVLVAWLSVKWARYEAALDLRLEVDAPLAGRHDVRTLNLRAKGFYFDVSGAYQGYSGGIGLARNDALHRAILSGIEGSLGAVERALEGLPLVARVDAVLPEQEGGWVLVATGQNAQVPIGTRYQLADDASVALEVVKPSAEQNASIARVLCGSLDRFRAGQIFKEKTDGPLCPEHAPTSALASASGGRDAVVSAEPQSPEVVANEDIDLGWKDLPEPEWQGKAPKKISRIVAWFKSLLETAMLPYRIWRYYQYDQALAKGANSTPWKWAKSFAGESWAKKIGLAAVAGQAFPETVSDEAPLVAVVDTGVDYNHGALHDAIWINPTPTTDSRGQKDRYGWDFVSGDPRPFDDAYRGTEVASAIIAAAPWAKLMPLKAFNAWGITHGGAIYGAIRYAADHGAKIIVCAWGTSVASDAIKEAIRYAGDRGAIVVTTTGDRGKDLARSPIYPAAWANELPNLLVVMGASSADQPLRTDERASGYGKEIAQIAAPAEKIHVALPRGEHGDESASWVSAGLVAGAVARIATRLPEQKSREWVKTLLEEAERVPALERYVEAGRRLKIIR